MGTVCGTQVGTSACVRVPCVIELVCRDNHSLADWEDCPNGRGHGLQNCWGVMGQQEVKEAVVGGREAKCILFRVSELSL